MDSSQPKAASIFATLRTPSRQRKAGANPSRMTCESLEGRQLLAGGMSFAGSMPPFGMGGPADVAPGATTGDEMTRGQVDPADATANFVAQSSASPGGDMTIQGGPAMGITTLSASTMMLPPSGTYASITPGNFGPGASDFSVSSGSTPGNFGPGASDASGSTVPDGESMPFHSTRMMDGFGGGGMLARGGSTTAAQASPPQESTAMTDALDKLRTDQQAIADKSQVTPALLAAVRNDLQAIDAARTGDGDATAIATLQTDADALRSAEVPTDDQLAKVQADTSAVFLSQGVTQDLIDHWTADILAVKTASNVSADDLNTLAADRAAIKTLSDAATPTATTSVDPSQPADATAVATTISADPAPPTDVPGTLGTVDPTQAAITTATATTDAATPDSTVAPLMATTGVTTTAKSGRKFGHGPLAGQFRQMDAVTARFRMGRVMRGGGQRSS